MQSVHFQQVCIFSTESPTCPSSPHSFSYVFPVSTGLSVAIKYTGLRVVPQCNYRIIDIYCSMPAHSSHPVFLFSFRQNMEDLSFKQPRHKAKTPTLQSFNHVYFLFFSFSYFFGRGGEGGDITASPHLHSN